MRLANGIVIDKGSNIRGIEIFCPPPWVHLQNEDGSVSEEIKGAYL